MHKSSEHKDTNKKSLMGDKVIWFFMILLLLASFLVSYSATAKLAAVRGDAGMSFLTKHFVIVVLGVGITYVVSRMRYQIFKGLGFLGVIASIGALLWAMFQGGNIGGANAARWIDLGFMTLQPSLFASVFLVIYVANFLHKYPRTEDTQLTNFVKLWLPIGGILLLIFFANLSTTVILGAVILLLLLTARYSYKITFGLLGGAIAGVTLFVVMALQFPDAMPNTRVATWKSRIEKKIFGDHDEGMSQSDKAKTAIALGGIMGQGPGKSKMKHFLPEANSDFVFAIIMEEYGVAGVLAVFVYFIIYLRIFIWIRKCTLMDRKLLLLGLGTLFISQTMVHLMVTVGLGPVTGQNLPLLSNGGSSIWATCLLFGVVHSVINAEKKAQAQKEENSIESELVEVREEVN